MQVIEAGAEDWWGFQTGLPVTRAFWMSPLHRKRENSLQEDRGSFVTTPTAELSSQEETLLGSFLDWSLDCCSGYEGDQESEGEKEGDGKCVAVLCRGCHAGGHPH